MKSRVFKCFCLRFDELFHASSVAVFVVCCSDLMFHVLVLMFHVIASGY